MTTIWENCYDGSWADLIVDEAFAHPAKFACGLIRRIYRHGFERGYWTAGDLIGDPFGGIGGGGIIASGMGLRWVGVELEKRFFDLALANFAKWKSIEPRPTMLLGDSREFAKLVGECDGLVTSPPYADTGAGEQGGQQRGGAKGLYVDDGDHYGTTPGQIGALKAGKLDAVVTSPPYAESIKGDHGETETAKDSRDKRQTPGGSLGQSQRHGGYGQTEGNIGNDKDESYWEAMSAVYRQCWLAIKPGGVMAVVIKDYIKKGKRVPLCDDTWKLLQACGFETIERCRAMLVKEETHSGLFGDVTTKKERKSFFRRLAEKKGSPPIDWEEVLWVRRLDAPDGE